MSGYLMSEQWVRHQFKDVDLNDKRRDRRLQSIVADVARHPSRPLNAYHGNWSQTKSLYRFFNNPKIDPQAMTQDHQHNTRQLCQSHPVVLCVSDGTGLGNASLTAERQVQHSTLAVTPAGGLLGMLHQRFFQRPTPKVGETRTERLNRWRESCIWSEAARSVADLTEVTYPIMVSDRASDVMAYMHACVDEQMGFVIRAQHDRQLVDVNERLWPYMQDQPVRGCHQIEIHTQRPGNSRKARRGRKTEVSVRAVRVTLQTPKKDPGQAPLSVNAVYLLEVDPPSDVKAVEYLLLTTEPIDDWEQIQTVIDYYCRRWVIEEWHRALKEGCAQQKSQLKSHEALCRLSAVNSVVAVRLVRLRDAAQNDETSDSVEALREIVPWLLIQLVAQRFELDARTMTAEQFWKKVAQMGGHLGRKSDGQPGWKTVWRGMHELNLQAEGVRLILGDDSCG